MLPPTTSGTKFEFEWPISSVKVVVFAKPIRTYRLFHSIVYYVADIHSEEQIYLQMRSILLGFFLNEAFSVFLYKL